MWTWTAEHGLFQKPDRSCPPTPIQNGNGITLLHPISTGGTFTTPPLAAGTYFYACPVISPLPALLAVPCLHVDHLI